MSEKTIQILMIDDDADDALLIRKLLQAAPGAHYQVEWAATYPEGLDRLCKCGHDICLLDYNLGARTGLELLTEARQRDCFTPVIVLTGLGAEEVDRAALEAGALDYLSKVDLTASHLERSIRYSLQQAHTLQALRKARADLERTVARRTAELAVSEEMNRRIIESSQDCIQLLSLEGELLMMSSGGQSLFEISDIQPFLGRSWIDFWQGESHAKAAEALTLARAGRVGRFQGYCPTVTGKPKWWDVVLSPILDAAGRPERLLAVARDTTERRLSEQEERRRNQEVAELSRRQSETLAILDSMLANAPLGFAIFDRERRYVRINGFQAEINGLPVEDHLGRTIHEALPAQAPEIAPVLDRIFETGQAETNMVMTTAGASDASGARHWLAGFYPVRLPDGQVQWVGAVVMEITEQKRTEEALRRNEERLAEADRRKDEFLAMLAHELRNPLAPIRNAVQLLRLTAADANQVAKYREMIERQITHMARLLDDLLDVSRITRGKIELRREILDLRDIAERAVESTRLLVDAKRQELAYQTASAPLPVKGDPTRLEQVLRNLLHNATKYTEPGGCISLMVGTECGEDRTWHAVARVRDSGVGVAPEMLEMIFEPFVQAEHSLARTQGGLGIGLSMVKSLIALHGGRVTAHSDGMGQGSEFVIRLPLLDEFEGVAPASGSVAAGNGQASASEPERRILVVDDNEDAATSLSELLDLWGYRVRTVHDGRQALTAAREWRPELILLDIGLPGMDGYEVARLLRAEAATAGSFLVALTGYGAEADRRRAHEAGFNRHLTKPVALDQLQTLLRESLAA